MQWYGQLDASCQKSSILKETMYLEVNVENAENRHELWEK